MASTCDDPPAAGAIIGGTHVMADCVAIPDPFLIQPNTLGSFTRAKHQGLLELLLVVFRLGLDDGPLISIMIGGRGVDDSGNNASSNHAGGS